MGLCMEPVMYVLVFAMLVRNPWPCMAQVCVPVPELPTPPFPQLDLTGFRSPSKEARWARLQTPLLQESLRHFVIISEAFGS